MKVDTDFSNTQLAALGVWAATERGAEVPNAYWPRMDKTWRTTQRPNGSWPYRIKGEHADSDHSGMTAAAIATLFLAQEAMEKGKATRNGTVRDTTIENARQYLTQQFNGIFGGSFGGKANRTIYSLYALERAAVAGGYRYFGEKDWYKEASAHLLRTQNADGSWRGQVTDVENSGLTDTSLAILTLTYGRAPVILSKLEYMTGPADKREAGNWHQRPRDAASFSRWLTNESERLLNWQILTLQAPVEDMLDAPILYIAGDKPLDFTAEEKAKIKQYVESGGMVLGNADGDATAFTQSFMSLMSELFPYEFRQLPDDHVIFTRQQFNAKDWAGKGPKVLGLSNGSRELAILFAEGDPSAAWQSRAVAQMKPQHELMANMYWYMTERGNTRSNGQSHVLLPQANAPMRTNLKMARIDHPGNADPEPGGWRREATFVRNELGMVLTVETVKLGESKLAPNVYPIVHITGTTAVKFGDAGLTELRNYVEGGGMVFIDAAGGSTRFADAVREQFGRLFADKPMVDLEPTEPVFTAPYDLTKAQYRSYFTATSGVTTKPTLQAIVINKRPAVLFSPVDISTGLVGQSVDGVSGYAPAYAQRLVANVLSQAANKQGR